MKRLIQTILLLFTFHSVIYAQFLEEFSTIKGSVFFSTEDIKINSNSTVFYLFKNASDTMLINDEPIYLLPRDSFSRDDYFFGRKYLVGSINNEGEYFAKTPGGEVSFLTDTSITVFKVFDEDTLLTDDATYIKFGDQDNLLALNYSSKGQLLNDKHFKSLNSFDLSVDDLVDINDKLFITGYYGGTTNFDLDSVSHIGSDGSADSYVARMNQNFVIERIFGPISDNDDLRASISGSQELGILHSGTSGSCKIFNPSCDTLYNASSICFGSGFLYLFRYDLEGNCLHSKTHDYDYGSVTVESQRIISDSFFILAGNYNSTFIKFDNFSIDNPNNDFQGFLIMMKENLETSQLLQLGGSQGAKTIFDMLVSSKNEIYLSGNATADTVTMGSSQIINENTGSAFGFLAKLNSNLETIFLIPVNESALNLSEGADGEIYMLSEIKPGSQILYRVVDSLSNTSIVYNDNVTNIHVWPNPVLADENVYFALGTGIIENTVNTINVFDSQGLLLNTVLFDALYEKKLSTSTYPKGLIILQFVFFDGRSVVKKILKL